MQQCLVESKAQEKRKLVESMAGKVVAHRHGKHPKTIEQLEEWLWSRVNIVESGCWEWIGPLSRDGYAAIEVNYGGSKVYRAHRLSWLVCFGPIPNELRVLHKCDNPKCVNPEHLWLGTMKENTWDSVFKGRANRAKGELSGRSKLSESEVRDIRRMHSDGEAFVVLARKFNVSRQTARHICIRKTWKHVL